VSEFDRVLDVWLLLGKIPRHCDKASDYGSDLRKSPLAAIFWFSIVLDTNYNIDSSLMIHGN
jgi:hypothetical protein